MSDVLRTLNQERATYALNKIKTDADNIEKDKYKSYAEKLPAMIVNNGLAPTLAFIKQQGEGAWQQIYCHLKDWLCERKLCNGDLLEDVLKMDAAQYRRCTREALAFAEWLKRIAQVELG